MIAGRQSLLFRAPNKQPRRESEREAAKMMRKWDAHLISSVVVDVMCGGPVVVMSD